MDAVRNPYTPGAGSVPPEVSGREAEFRDFKLLIDRLKLGNHERSIVIYGPRGVGKTVCLIECEPIAQTAGFHTNYKELTPESSLLGVALSTTEKLIRKLSLTARAKMILSETLGYLSSFRVTAAGDIEFSFSRTVDEDRLSEDLSDLFIEVGKLAVDNGTGMILLLDEIQFANQVELRSLLSALHRVSQKNLPIAIAAAGLPQVPGVLASARSYAERLFTYRPLGQLSEAATRQALSDPAAIRGVTFTDAALDEAVRWSRCYPFYIQQIGKDSWSIADGPDRITADDVVRAQPVALKNIDDGFFRARAQKATLTEEEFMLAMASLGSGPYQIGDIAGAMKRPSTTSISPIREGLIKKGLIHPTDKRGYVEFSVPLFDEYLTRHIA